MEKYINKIINADCLDILRQLPDKCIDLVLTDPPYGTTACKWDSVIPFEPMWNELKRITKDNGAICLFGAEPFSSALRMSNIEMYKYDWIWVKNNAVGFVNAKLKPMNKHEVISIFSRGKTSNGNKNNMIYFPQGLIPFGKLVKSGNKKNKDNTYYRPSQTSVTTGRSQEFTNYPATVLNFAKENNAIHPTQKPVALFEYLIRTYSTEGELVLDFCSGSGTTAVACHNLNRQFICIEKDPEYWKASVERLEKVRQQMTLF